METKERTVTVLTKSNYGTKMQITVSANTDDLYLLIKEAINKIARYEKGDEKFKIVHIDSLEK